MIDFNNEILCRHSESCHYIVHMALISVILCNITPSGCNQYSQVLSVAQNVFGIGRSFQQSLRTNCPQLEHKVGVILVRISRIWTECGEIPYSIRMRENMDQNNSEYGHFLRIELLPYTNSINIISRMHHHVITAIGIRCLCRYLCYPPNLAL